MKLKSIILGVATTAVLLLVLLAPRMMVLDNTVKEFDIREIETVSLPEPPPPPLEEVPEDDVPPPPPPATAKSCQDTPRFSKLDFSDATLFASPPLVHQWSTSTSDA